MSQALRLRLLPVIGFFINSKSSNITFYHSPLRFALDLHYPLELLQFTIGRGAISLGSLSNKASLVTLFV